MLHPPVHPAPLGGERGAEGREGVVGYEVNAVAVVVGRLVMAERLHQFEGVQRSLRSFPQALHFASASWVSNRCQVFPLSRVNSKPIRSSRNETQIAEGFK